MEYPRLRAGQTPAVTSVWVFLKVFEMRVSLALLIAVIAISSGVPAAEAKHAPRPKAAHAWQKPRVDRDCTPINGFYGYYGNPWCDTGSSRPPDIEFRENHRHEKRLMGF